MLALCISTWIIMFSVPCSAHHVLGRPAYSLNEDSTTPPSMQVETQIGAYFVTYMVFPAFPSAGEPGRVNLYASRISDGRPFDGEVAFKVRDRSWFSNREEILGTQPPDDNVYRQGFLFSNDGSYIIRAAFRADGEPYEIDFPLQIGQRSVIGPLGAAIAVISMVLVGVTLWQRNSVTSAKIRTSHRGDY